MAERKSDEGLAREMAISAVRLVRGLRSADEAAVLTRSQSSALGVIVYSGGVSPSALADLERVHRPTMTRVISELVNRDLVARQKDPRDARGVILRPTAKGRDVWQRGQARTVAPLVERIAALTSAERDKLEELLPIILRLAEPPPPGPEEKVRKREEGA